MAHVFPQQARIEAAGGGHRQHNDREQCRKSKPDVDVRKLPELYHRGVHNHCEHIHRRPAAKLIDRAVEARLENQEVNRATVYRGHEPEDTGQLDERN